MPPRKLFGSLNLEGNIGKGENPNGVVRQTANGAEINGQGADGDDYAFGLTADGRWNHRPKIGGMEDRSVPRPVAVLVPRRR
jgi:hypothetical protein